MPIYSQNKQIIKIMNNNNDVLFNAIKNINEKSMTGAPSLQFQSNGDNLTNYTIYGNKNGVGDYNLTTQKYDIPITVSNKNLFDMSKVDLVNLNPQFGTGKVIQFDSSVYSLVMPLEEGLYTFSILAPLNDNLRNRQRIACYSRYPQLNDETLSWTEISHRENDVGDILSVRFSAPHGTKYIMIFLWYKDYPLETITSILESIQIMIQPGDIVTNYIAHNSNTTNIQLDAPLSFNDKKEIKNHNLQTYSGLNIFSVNTEKKPVAITLNNDNFTYINSGLQKFYTVRYYNEDELVYTEYVPADKNAMGLAEEASPKKISSEQYDYIFKGWSAIPNQSIVNANILNNITNNKDVYAVFEQVERTFTVQFYGEDINTPIQTVQNVPYGGNATYSESTPTKSGYRFTGWNPEPTNIYSDTSCYAQFEQVSDYITDSWETIDNRGKAGTAQNYYSVGDCKPIELNGTMGTLELDHETVYVYILGFNHNSTYEPNGITFGGFKTAATNGVDVCLVDSNYGSSDTSGTKYFNMSHRGYYNYGGWAGSDMRYDILGSTDVQPLGYGSDPTTSKTGYDATSTCATNPVANTLMSCLPSDLRAVMKPMTKYTDNTGNSSDVEANVTSSIDYLPLLSEYEVQGARTYANQYEQNKQARYAYYAAGNSKVKYQHSSTSSAARWWCRSADYSNSNTFCNVITSGGTSGYNASSSRGVAPIFLVGTAPTTYTVTYYSQDGQTVLSTETVEEGHDCTYSTAPTKESDTDFNYTFTGWSTSTNSTTATTGTTENIQQNTDLYAAFSKSFKTDTISDSWEEIIANCDNGTYASKYQVGDLKTIDVGTEGPVQMQIVAIDTDLLASDNTKKTPITWISKQLLNTYKAMHSTSSGYLPDWANCDMRTYLRSTILPMLPSVVQNGIKEVTKYTCKRTSSTAYTTVSATENIWLPSYREVSNNTSNCETSGVQYNSIFTDNASRVKSKVGNSAYYWWTRSASGNSNSAASQRFAGMDSDGTAGYYGRICTGSVGVAIGFCT